jgi:hypothetical protein
MTPSRKARPQAHGSFIAWLLWADEQLTPRPVADLAGPDTTISHRHNYKA